MPSLKVPSLDSVTTINQDGSRYVLHVADVQGPFTKWRRLTAIPLLAIYFALPWIPFGGYPAMFLDLANRRFHFFGLTLATQDAWLLFFLITGLAFSLFFVTALFGRIWCGWTCPYTVFLEHLYRRVERWIDGDAAAQRKLYAAPWTIEKLFRRVLKHSLFILISAVLANVFLSYFVSIPRLYAMMRHSPLENLQSFGVVAFFTAALYFCFSWFREQFCIILCPYGRFQSVLTDEHTMVIGYDEKRGEPRGKASDPNAGHCVDCRRCVHVCPTGIDIREGLQIECIGCAACIDACNDVMQKLKRPKGLVRYDSLLGLRGIPARWIRPRTVVYTGFLIAGLSVLASVTSQLTPLTANLVRMPGPPFFQTQETVRNHFGLRVINKLHEPARFKLELLDAPGGSRIVGAEAIRELPPLGEDLITVPIETPIPDYHGTYSFRIQILSEQGKPVTSVVGSFAGPNPRLLSIHAQTGAKS
jgi:cytochrome c oxidase accessory protein FixG